MSILKSIHRLKGKVTELSVWHWFQKPDHSQIWKYQAEISHLFETCSCFIVNGGIDLCSLHIFLFHFAVCFFYFWFVFFAITVMWLTIIRNVGKWIISGNCSFNGWCLTLQKWRERPSNHYSYKKHFTGLYMQPYRKVFTLFCFRSISAFLLSGSRKLKVVSLF